MFAYTDPGELPQIHVAADGLPLPLEHTDVRARVRGHVARVWVEQRFVNDRNAAIEVTYTFPLPENAAVDTMRMTIGERVIEAEVQTREQARETYSAARDAGQTAALLEQERANVFTQSVANIAPGEAIEIEIAYLQTLTQDGGVEEFVFPMVVGPRFIPGVPGSAPEDPSATGTKAATALVSDAARITPPVVGEGERSGNDVSLSLEVDAGLEIASWDAPTHTVSASPTARGFVARLADAQTIPNRDFVIRWQTASQTPRATLFLAPLGADGRGHFMLEVTPPRLELDEFVGRREMIFVVDRSGSMSGVPLPADTDRYVFFLTDGYIGDEHPIVSGAAELVERARISGQRARVFGLGIGAAPNRELIAELSRAGDGVALHVSNREHPGQVVDDYYCYVDHAVLTDIRVDYAGLGVESLSTTDYPDLFASHGVVILGRYAGELRGDVELHATLPGSDPFVMPVEVASVGADERIISTLWARDQITWLASMTWDRRMTQSAAREAITALGLEHHLVTAYTSFVAVDHSRVVSDGDSIHVTQAVEIPEDIDPLLSGATSVTRAPARTPESSGGTYRAMKQLEKQAASLERIEREQEARRREQLLELERRALATRMSYAAVRADRDLDEAIQRAIRDTLASEHLRLFDCVAKRDHVTITLWLELDAGASVIGVRVRSESLTRETTDAQLACVEPVVRGLDWGAVVGGPIELEIDLQLD